MIQRRNFLGAVAAIVLAPLKVFRRSTVTVSPITPVAPVPIGDCGGFIVPKEFTAAIVLMSIARVSRYYHVKLAPPLTLEDVCRLRGVPIKHCADCGGLIGNDRGPPDGWQLEDGRTVCHRCCAEDTKKTIAQLRKTL